MLLERQSARMLTNNSDPITASRVQGRAKIRRINIPCTQLPLQPGVSYMLTERPAVIRRKS